MENNVTDGGPIKRPFGGTDGFLAAVQLAAPRLVPRSAARIIELAKIQKQIMDGIPLDDRGFSGVPEFSRETAAKLCRLHIEIAELAYQELSQQRQTPETQAFLAGLTQSLHDARAILQRFGLV